MPLVFRSARQPVVSPQNRNLPPLGSGVQLGTLVSPLLSLLCTTDLRFEIPDGVSDACCAEVRGSRRNGILLL